MNVKQSTYFNNWAYDINKDPLLGGEQWNIDVIDQSIELIMGTIYGERLFNPSFGCGLQLYTFENLTNATAVKMLQNIVDALKQWEDRITVDETNIKLVVNTDNNSVVISIPYVININGIKNTFTKKIIA